MDRISVVVKQNIFNPTDARSFEIRFLDSHAEILGLQMPLSIRVYK